MKHVSVIQHTQSEWLGQIEDHLEGRGIRFGYSRPFTTGGTIPEATVVGDGLILLGGGPWNARDSAGPGARTLPTLDTEVRLARACLMLGKPVIGIGLGSQILALAAEGGVEPAPLALTVGEAVRVMDGALGGLLPERFPNVVYMRDRARPPDYASILAVDAEGHPALFQIGPNAFGFSGHPGVRRAMIEDLVMEFEEAPVDAAAGLEKLTALGPAIDDALVPIMAGLIAATGWMAD
jgi:GMP synthase-like glutamine amidotransferase